MILRWTSQRSSRNASCAPSPQRDAPSSSSQRLAGIAIALAVLLAPGAAAAPPQQLGHQYQQIAFVAPAPAPAPAEAGPSSFSLVHAVHFGTHSHPGLRVQHRFDPADEASYASLALPSSSSSSAFSAQLSGEDASFEDSKAALYPAIETFPIRTVRQTIWKPSHPARSEVYEAARRVSMPQFAGDQSLRAIGEQLSWEQVEVASPDVADVTTLSTLAKMSSNAYSTSQDEGWYDLSSNDTSRPSYNLSSSFGWEEDGIRGHVFSSGPANETIVIALKGTSAFVGGGRTGRNDKLNDNLLFSCCCARIDWTWSPVCDCYNGTSSKSGDQRCNLTCLEDALIEKSVYYPTATDLFNNITDMYPRSQIWLTGHSLGGSLAALLGVTFGIPTVTFEAPGDLLPAKRLHLPLPPGSDWSDPDSRPDFGITHVYTNSDPIPQGVVSRDHCATDIRMALKLPYACSPSARGRFRRATWLALPLSPNATRASPSCTMQSASSAGVSTSARIASASSSTSCSLRTGTGRAKRKRA